MRALPVYVLAYRLRSPPSFIYSSIYVRVYRKAACRPQGCTPCPVPTRRSAGWPTWLAPSLSPSTPARRTTALTFAARSPARCPATPRGRRSRTQRRRLIGCDSVARGGCFGSAFARRAACGLAGFWWSARCRVSRTDVRPSLSHR